MGHRCSGKMPNAMPAAAAKDPRTELDWDGHADVPLICYHGLMDSWTHGPLHVRSHRDRTVQNNKEQTIAANLLENRGTTVAQHCAQHVPSMTCVNCGTTGTTRLAQLLPRHISGIVRRHRGRR